MKKIIKRMLQAKTKEELLTCEVDLQIQYNHLSEELLEDGAISEKDYEGILTFYRSSRELLVDINEKAENLQKKFPRAIEILQLDTNGQPCDPREKPDSRIIRLKRPKIIYIRDCKTDKEKWKW